MIDHKARNKADDTIKRARAIDEAYRLDGQKYVHLDGNEAALHLLLQGEYTITHFSRERKRVKLALKEANRK
tara:strand:- start:1325 stop:1540 length:216 start_codon:yes stop_codon:yes gene_type:complete